MVSVGIRANLTTCWLLLLLLLLGSTCRAVADGDNQPQEPTGINEASITQEMLEFTEKVREGEYRKIGTILGHLVDFSETSPLEDLLAKSFPYLQFPSQNQVIVDVIFQLNSNSGNAGGSYIPDDFEAMGFQTLTCIQNVCSGYADVDLLVDLSNHPNVQFINPSLRPITHAGSVTSEGDQSMNSDTGRSFFGLSGAGQAVGVLSDSYDCCTSCSTNAATDISTGDLPNNVNVLDDVTSSGCIDEGRAMFQLIHDVAPGADLLFHTALPTSNVFAQGILDLAAAGCTVIVDDISYFRNPFFQDDDVTQAVFGMGIPYFSSAGNSARHAWHTDTGFVASTIVDPNGNPLHNFGTSSAVDILQGIGLIAGISYVIVLQWDQPFGSVSGSASCQSNVDFFLTDSSGGILQFSVDNNVGGDAVEVIIFQPTLTAVYFLAISLASGTAPGYLKWLMFTGTPIVIEHDVLSSTLVQHHNAAGGAGVGAARFDNTPRFGVSPPVQESFTSAGGTPIFFDTSGTRLSSAIVRDQPRVTGPDGGVTTFFGASNRFFGTSAAAPHVAAVAALLLEQNSTLTPTDIYSRLQSTAIDMDDTATSGFDTGFDTGTGYGLVNAYTALGGTSAPTFAPTSVPTPAPAVPPGTCFSEVSTVKVQGKGTVKMKDLQVGDRVWAGNKGFQLVYAFAHYNPVPTTEFLQIYTNNHSLPLEITSDHLVYLLLQGKKAPVPAAVVQTGNVLLTRASVEGSLPKQVTKISKVNRKGIYAPLTASGDIEVDGVLASNYIAVQGGPDGKVRVAGYATPLSQHFVIHLTLSPFRLLSCLGLYEANYNEDGMPHYIEWGISWINWAMNQHSYVQWLLFALALPVFVSIYVAEMGIMLLFSGEVWGAAATVSVVLYGVAKSSALIEGKEINA